MRGEKLANFDVSFVDQASGLLFFADRSNKCIDVIDTKSDRFVGRMGSFVGAVVKDGKVDNETSGPDGVVLAGKEVWAGDGDNSLKIIDTATGKVTATVNTGGKTRVDEMAVDDKDGVFIGVNNAEDPPYATVLSTKPDHAVIGKVVFVNATDGAEQPAYNPNDGLFYVSTPELDEDAKKGAVAVIDPKAGKLVKMIPVENCHPAGLAFGPDDNFVLGCTADGKEMPAVITIMPRPRPWWPSCQASAAPTWSTTTRRTASITPRRVAIPVVPCWASSTPRPTSSCRRSRSRAADRTRSPPARPPAAFSCRSAPRTARTAGMERSTSSRRLRKKLGPNLHWTEALMRSILLVAALMLVGLEGARPGRSGTFRRSGEGAAPGGANHGSRSGGRRRADRLRHGRRCARQDRSRCSG